MNEETFLSLWLPKYPYATDSWDFGMYRMKREKAIQKRFIETCPKTMRNLIVLDVDIDQAEWHIKGIVEEEELLPPPSFITINPVSEHAQVGYFIEGFSHTPKAQLFFNDVSKGLQSVMLADAAYGGRTMRNPLHSYQKTIWGVDTLYTLNELKEYTKNVNMNNVINIDNNTIGRNRALFDSLRVWAYRERLKYNDYSLWYSVVYNKAFELNNSLEEPLRDKEVYTIVKGITTFTWKKFSKESFSDLQSYRSNKRQVVIDAEQKYATYIDYHYFQGLSILDIADIEGVSYENAKKTLQRAKKYLNVNV